MIYEYRDGSKRIAGMTAEELAIELENLRVLHGGKLTPEAVVTAARDESSPLHNAFEWNDEKAAEAHRLWQARTLIKTVVVKRDSMAAQIPAFIHVKVENTPYYQSSAVAVSDKTEWEAAISEAKKKLSSAQDSLDMLLRIKPSRPATRARALVGQAVERMAAV